MVRCCTIIPYSIIPIIEFLGSLNQIASEIHLRGLPERAKQLQFLRISGKSCYRGHMVTTSRGRSQGDPGIRPRHAIREKQQTLEKRRPKPARLHKRRPIDENALSL